MSQITGTITFSTTGLIYPEHLELSLCRYDSNGLKKYAKFESSKVFKDFTYEINLDERELEPATQHFIEIRYAGLSVHTLPANVSTLLTPDYDIAFFSLNYKMELSGTVMTTRGVAIGNNTVTLLRHELLELNSISSTTTDSSGYFQIIFSFPVSNIIAFIDPDIYPSFLGNNYLDLQVKTIDPQNQKDPDVYSEIYYDVRNSLRIDFVIGNENLNDKPEYVKKQETFNATSEFANLTLSELEQATTKPEYISKKLKSSTEEATHVIKTKYYKTKFSCDEEVMFALLKENVNRNYQDIMFTTSDKLKEEVNTANERNITNFVEGKGHTLNGAIATLKANLIAAYIAEQVVSEKFTLMGVSNPSTQTAIVEATINWKNDVEKQNNGTSLNEYLLLTGKIGNSEYQKAEVYDKVATISLNSIDLSVAILEDTSLSWTSVDDIIAAKDDFETLITGYLNASAITLPDGINDATEYATHITKQLELQYPSQFMKYEVIKTGSTLFAGTNIAILINNNPQFQFGENHAWATMAYTGLVLPGLNDNDKEQLKVDLQEAEQIFKLTPEANKSVLAGVMKTKDFTASYKIARITRTAFLEQMRDELPVGNDVTDEELSRIHAVASYITNAATLDMMRLEIGQTPTVTSVIPSYSYNSTDTSSGFPSICELFGSQDYFEYPQCRTLFSQAAYLTDLLNFLKSSSKTDLLFARRPDLKHILLNCSNTENVLPHIDLVNEILERAVLLENGQLDIDLTKLQTTWTNEELAAYPENLKITAAAYNYLKNAVAPWSLPFNLNLEEYRSYLKTLGLTREKIIEKLSPVNYQTGDPVAHESLFESLGLSTKEVECITDQASEPADLNTYYPGIVIGTTIEKTGNVKHLMGLTGLSYDQIKELLDSYFINPVNGNGNRYFLYTIPGALVTTPEHIEVQTGAQPGTLESTYIMNEDETGDTLPQPSPDYTFYDRLHRFERLRRKLDLKVYQLDLILKYLNCTVLNENDILKIAYFFKVKSQFNLKLEESLLFFNDFAEGVSYPDYINLFDFIFLKNSENYKFKDSFKFLMGYVEEDTNVEDFEFDNLQTILPYISGIKITEQQYNTILIKSNLTAGVPNLENLSKIFRIVYTCKVLQITIDEYYALTNLTGSLNIETPSGFLQLTEIVNKIKAYGFSIPDLAYLLGGEEIEGNQIFVSTVDIISDLETLQQEIRPTDNAFYRKYVELNAYNFFKEDIETALSYIFEDFTVSGTAVADFIDLHPDLFYNFSVVPANETLSLKEYFLANAANKNNKIKAVLYGYGLETDFTATVRGLFYTYNDFKKVFTTVKAKLLGKILDKSSNLKVYLDIPQNTKSKYEPPRSEKKDLDAAEYRDTLSRTSYNYYNYRIILDLNAHVNIADFISNNSAAFPSGEYSADFLYPFTENINLELNVNTRYKRFVFEMSLDIYNEKLQDIRNLLLKQMDELDVKKCIDFILLKNTESVEEGYIEEKFQFFMMKDDITNILVNDQSVTYLDNYCERIDFVLNKLKQELSADIIVNYFASLFETDEKYISEILFDYLMFGANDLPGIESFVSEDYLKVVEFSLETESELTDQLDVYRRLYKATLFINQFNITSEMLSSIVDIYDDEKFNLLDIFSNTGSTNTLEKYLNLNSAVALSHTYFADETDFFTFFKTNSDLSDLDDTAKIFIQNITGCKSDDLTALNTGQDHVLPVDLYINWFNSLLECQYIIKHLGTTAQTIINLNKTDSGVSGINTDHSEMLRQLVKNKYSEDVWYSISESLRNPLREKQRDALRDYLIIKNATFTDTNDLFHHFLIDSEMTTLVKTTRITQATLSVQLFIQRVLMGLETDLNFNEDEKNELVWRKNYRVWEANRKILFFPENWLDPELRRNKSPFFKELEEKLLQNDIDDSTVLQAYYEYIDKLDEVSNLEILSLHRVGGLRSCDNNILHMLGRTYGSPYKYYYRKLSNNNSWTPWEEIQNGIKGDIVQLCYWENELYMFWLETFITNEIPEKNISKYSVIEISGEDPKYTAIRISWSKYKNNKWTPAITSDEMYVEPQNAKTTNIALTVFPHTNEINKKFVELGISFDDSPNTSSRPHYLKKRGSFIFNGAELYFKYEQSYGNLSKIYASLNDKVVVNNKIKCDNAGYSPCFFLYFRSAIYNYELSESNRIILLGGPNLGCKSYNIIYENIVRPNSDYYFAESSLSTWFKPFVLEDRINNKNFLAVPIINLDPIWNVKDDCSNMRYIIMSNNYSCVEDIKNALKFSGVNGLFSRSLHDKAATEFKVENMDFVSYYGKGDHVLSRNVDLELLFGSKTVDESTYVPSICDPYALYNWELFYHIPLLIADNLSRNMKFEEAQKWYHKIFDPTIGDNSYSDADGNVISADAAPKKYWKIKPFREIFTNAYSPENITEFINELHKTEGGAYKDLVDDWESDPFNPHKIAETRPVAYMKSIVVKYIDNLLGWADMLFTKDTLEDVNQAMLLYILAADILGIKPQKLEGTLPEAKSFSGLGPLDVMSNAFDTINGILTVVADHNNISTEQTASFGAVDYQVSYFGVPHNSKMVEYWDVVADRLFKIRHSMNIQGVLRELPITAPPIDPGAVAAAMASGADLSSALSTLSAPMPLYRFNYMLQKAIEFTNDVKALGNTMLSVLEKKDAEDMAILRSTQEQIMLGAMTQIREKAIEEANENINSLIKTKDNTTARRDYYKNKKQISVKENKALNLYNEAFAIRTLMASIQAYGAVVSAIPDFKIGLAPGFTFGGSGLKNIQNALFAVAGVKADVMQNSARHTDTMASYERRDDDWQFQKTQASGELLQIERQLAASKVRLAMSEKELENHLKQIEQKKEEYEFMKTKFTNKQLYNWMKGEVSKLYQSAFQMAHKLALAAEKAYIFERQKDNYSSFITSAYWDNLREGLMAGELLYNDLRRLEMEYMETNSREMELSKDIPLSMINPKALIDLQTTGTCNFDIPEMLYDIDHPGHYMRRIKAVSVSIPAVTGPYSGVTCKMSLLNNRFRKSTSASSPYNYQGIDDLRFIHNIIGIQSIATSTGNNDTGMFEFNFRDERYLPFEGAGAIGEWQIELPNTIRKFDYESISDVILHVKYTARDAGGTLKIAAEGNINSALNTLMDELAGSGAVLKVAHSLKSEFADEIYELVKNGEATIEISEKCFPFIFRDWASKNTKVIKITNIRLYSKVNLDSKLFEDGDSNMEWTPVTIDTVEVGYYYDIPSISGSNALPYSLEMSASNFEADGDVYILLDYEIVLAE